MPASLPLIRPWDPQGPDAAVVGRLVGAYLRQTEREKAAHLRGESLSLDAKLPTRYRLEAEDPASAYASASVLVAEADDALVGVVVLEPGDGATGLKRLWTVPAARGAGVGSALVEAAVEAAPGTLRAAVWEWRNDARRLYAAHGFERVESWDDRPRLVCLERPQD